MRTIAGLIIFSATVLAQGGGAGAGAGIGGATRSASFVSASQNCNSAGTSGTGGPTSFVYTFRFGSCYAVPSIEGAPYSGRNTSETVRTLADGTRLTQPAMTGPMTYRDGAGRTRTDRTVPSGPSVQNQILQKQIVVPEINDPVAGYHYVLDPQNREAHRIRVQTMHVSPGGVPAQASSGTMANGVVRTREPLGDRTMLGLTATGVRMTTTYPPGTYQGNDRAVTEVNETWNAVRYGLVLLSKSSGVSGDSTNTMTDLTLGEPDPTLFQIPSGYRIVDEAGEFTITIQRTAQ